MYYLLLDGAPAGPFTLAQLMELWQARRVNTLTLYWEEGNADWLPLHNIEPLLKLPAQAASPSAIPPLPAGPSPVSPPRPPAAAPAAPASAFAADEELVWSGHPSLWHWTGQLFWALFLFVLPAPISIGTAIFHQHAGYFWLAIVSPVILAILLFIHVFWSRGTTSFQVTNRRVSVQAGVFTRLSRELRIADIRSIGARSNIFGIGDLEFSTAARDDAEVTFWGLTRVQRVRDLVKQLQNGQA